MNYKYTREKHCQVVISLLKAHGIRHVIASPGTTNTAFVCSIQNDPHFIIYSAVDERSAAYMACGMAAEIDAPVVISCTGATASRNYLPGLTEAYYRKLPVLALTSSQSRSKVGHLVAQVIDRSSVPKDAVRLSVALPIVKDDDDVWECEMKVNRAILELTRDGGGPVHIDLATTYTKPYDVIELPHYRKIRRVEPGTNELPALNGKVSVFVGSHKRWTEAETQALDRFCEAYDVLVICDHTSSYHGKYRLLPALAAGQQCGVRDCDRSDIMIHIGEVSGDYVSMAMAGTEVWRVSADGEIRDTFKRLSCLFAMSEKEFFERYTAIASKTLPGVSRFNSLRDYLNELRQEVEDLPFSNIWIAAQAAQRIPPGACVHLGILNTLRSWNFFDFQIGVEACANVGGFGIDGVLSAAVGASLAARDRIQYVVIGDLAFFYDMNALGNRHIRDNLRVLVVNNGKGTEFRQFNHHASYFEEGAEPFVAASGHFGNKSRDLVKGYAEALGFEYMTADDKDGFCSVIDRFVCPTQSGRPMLLEVFTDSEMESRALEDIYALRLKSESTAKKVAKSVFGDSGLRVLKKVLKAS